ncbi:hypothetical protein FA09DRAFT_323306 [Tilletiopsis washingtonensis]|uniref:Mitochondrial import inner membrane translocase subunit n=1 Tax=Tilletiopsis washingtonensis TaxID=58919 RepID=A0A316Z1T7_9BASI|nr:hypothetical protein FA09DRAFT_323306 [Tilletiopsis washingtonensis]PWN94882.1 hypothetical protein FA09DRAFT_323306 [Tilletiopsis washingtonensis]
MDLSSLTGKKGASSAELKEAFKAQTSQELAQSSAQALFTKATEKCFAKCVPAPGTSLSSKEQACTERCVERYFEAFNLVSNAYARRVAAMREAGPDALA